MPLSGIEVVASTYSFRSDTGRFFIEQKKLQEKNFKFGDCETSRHNFALLSFFRITKVN
jgi:hypothetical protein